VSQAFTSLLIAVNPKVAGWWASQVEKRWCSGSTGSMASLLWVDSFCLSFSAAGDFGCRSNQHFAPRH